MKKLMSTLAVLTIMLSAFAAEPGAKEAKTPIELDRDSFIENVFDYREAEEWNYIGDKPAIIDFWAGWCGPCRQIAPVLEDLAKEYGDDIYVYKVNVDEQTELAQTFGIRSLPTLLFVPMDAVPQAVMGAAPKSKLKNAVETILLGKEEE